VAGALSGIKVLDLSRVYAGPWCTQILADLGAEVIKIERPDTGDDTRGWGPPWLKAPDGGDLPDSAYFSAANRGKKSVALDLSSPQAQALVRGLAEQCDVMVENYKVGDLSRYGLDYARISSINPRIIYCSITAYGQDGPYARKPGYDLVLQGLGGLMSVTGVADGQAGGGPLKVGVPVVDVITGMYAAVATLAALHHRAASGRGQYIDTALIDCIVALGSNQAVDYLSSGNIPTRHGNAHPNLVPYQVFATADRHIVVAVGNDPQWQRLCKAVNRPDLANDARFLRSKGRVANRIDLVDELQKLLAERTSVHWLERLEREDVPCGPINSYADVFRDPQVMHRALKVDLRRPDGTKVQTMASPIRLGATPVQYDSAPPKLGEHTASVLESMLKMNREDIARLRATGAIG
jgi:crotonobetainyl-CoA:carnitine CoA-transferase CaiB-like acyl-CoA transferase